MRFLLGIVIVALVIQVSALEGSWKFTEVIYQGVRGPLPNPNLNLVFTFFGNGTERLYWDRTGASGFCERFAEYKIDGPNLLEYVFAINPKNDLECGMDIDMKVGRRTITPIEISEKEIKISVGLGDQSLIYVFTPTNQAVTKR